MSSMDVATERDRGVVKFFNGEKGFGFCSRANGKLDVFVHANELKRSGVVGTLEKGDNLEFDVVPVDGKGPKATAIRRI